MRLVHEENRIVPFGEVGQIAERGQVAVHAEYAVHGDEAPPRVCRFFQAFLKVVHIVVGEDLDRRSAETAAGGDARVVEAVAEHRVPLSGESGNQAGVRQKARPEKKGRFLILEPGDFTGKGFVGLHMARDERARGGARAPSFGGLSGGGGQQGMIGKTEIVVAGEVDDLPALESHHRPMGAREGPEAAAQITVRERPQVLADGFSPVRRYRLGEGGIGHGPILETPRPGRKGRVRGGLPGPGKKGANRCLFSSGPLHPLTSG